VHWFDTIDSTNTQAKHIAREGAPHGTVLIAGHQTGGRGRMGRSFSSPVGMGLYLSVILRPGCAASELMHLTCAAGIAACEAVENTCGIRPGIKWINDLVLNSRKLGGILTEMSVDPKTGLVDFAVIGIGINCLQSPEDFPPELQEIAISLKAAGNTPDMAQLAAKLILALYDMSLHLQDQERIMTAYRQDCITLGRQVVILRADAKQYGTALDVDKDGALVVRLTDGSVCAVNSGEVSVRGLYGYV
jgi:BirA family biotin operon repressor/biotin-[acetyl-CoA-carboxylase] ligase